MIDFVDQWHPEKLHLGRVPTAVLYDDEGKVSMIPDQTLRIHRRPLMLYLCYKVLACGAKAAAAQADIEGHVPFGEQLHRSKKGQSDGGLV